MEQELVSVIMPTFNTGEYLSDSIECVLQQSHRNLELLITDDASTEELTKEILNRYAARDARVKIVELESNHGPSYARNNAIKRAQGRYIAFCDSDDLWMPEKLERQIACMEEHDSALCYTSYTICNEQGNTIGVVKAPKYITFDQLKMDNKVGCSTAIYDTKRLGRKYYMPNLLKRQDWGLFLSILRDSHVGYGIQIPMAIYRQRADSVSSGKLGLVKYNLRVYTKVLGFSVLKAYFYFVFCFMPCYTLKVLKKKWDSWRYVSTHGNDVAEG